MNCDTCEPLLIDHLHGELANEERRPVAAHLTECSACALAYCRLAADVQGIAAAYAVQPSDSTRDRLRERVAAEFRPSVWRRMWRFVAQPVPAYGVACAAAIPLLLWAVSPAPPATSETDEAAPAVSKPARILDYDASTSLRDPRIL